MDIDKTNFEATLKIVFEAIDDCDFIAFDTEFTGLNGGLEKYKLNFFDTINDWYMKCCKTSAHFIPVQFGICTFKQDPKTKKFIVRAFNFFIYPQVPRHNTSYFHCQISSLQFLSEQGFDFNRWIKNGINWKLQSDIDTLVEKRRYRHNNYEDFCQTFSKVPIRVKAFIADLQVKVDKFIVNHETDKELILKCKNSYDRVSIHKYLKPTNQKNSTWLLFVDMDQCLDVKVIMSSREVVNGNRNKTLDLDLEDIYATSGFCQIIKRISDSGKPLVGHNLTLDLIHTINRFVCLLPESFDDFQEILTTTFPIIIDTKYIWGNSICKEFLMCSTIINIVNIMRKPPFTLPQIEFPDSENAYDFDNKKLHQAGYDAFLTGCIFISMSNYIVTKTMPMIYRPFDSPQIKQYHNRANLMRVNDINYIDLAKPNIPPDRTGVFVAKFHKKITHDFIIDSFKKYGDIFIAWIDDTSCFIKVLNPQNIQTVRQAINEKKIDAMKFTFYDEYMRDLWDERCSNCRDNDNVPAIAPSSSTAGTTTTTTSAIVITAPATTTLHPPTNADPSNSTTSPPDAQLSSASNPAKRNHLDTTSPIGQDTGVSVSSPTAPDNSEPSTYRPPTKRQIISNEVRMFKDSDDWD